MKSEKDNKRIIIDLNYPAILTIIFIVLKVLDKIQWSWWLVFSPIILEYGIVLLIGLLALSFSLIFGKFRIKTKRG